MPNGEHGDPDYGHIPGFFPSAEMVPGSQPSVYRAPVVLGRAVLSGDPGIVDSHLVLGRGVGDFDEPAHRIADGEIYGEDAKNQELERLFEKYRPHILRGSDRFSGKALIDGFSRPPERDFQLFGLLPDGTFSHMGEGTEYGGEEIRGSILAAADDCLPSDRATSTRSADVLFIIPGSDYAQVGYHFMSGPPPGEVRPVRNAILWEMPSSVLGLPLPGSDELPAGFLRDLARRPMLGPHMAWSTEVGVALQDDRPEWQDASNQQNRRMRFGSARPPLKPSELLVITVPPSLSHYYLNYRRDFCASTGRAGCIGMFEAFKTLFSEVQDDALEVPDAWQERPIPGLKQTVAAYGTPDVEFDWDQPFPISMLATFLKLPEDEWVWQTA